MLLNLFVKHPCIFSGATDKRKLNSSRVPLYIWAAAGHKLTAIGTLAQSFNL